MNGKFAWRKIFDHDPRFVILSDKIAAKEWVAQRGIAVETPKVLWSGTDAREIPDDVLAGDVVVKASHGWKMNIFVENGEYDREQLVKEANGFMRRSHGWKTREWAYYDVPRRLLVEEWIRPAHGDLVDLKVYAYGPHVEQIVPIRTGRDGRVAAIWEAAGGGVFRLADSPSAISDEIDRRPLPDTTDRAVAIASAIGADFDHLRVDFLTDGAALYLGEVTVYNLSGTSRHAGHLIDTPMNRSWDLRRSWFLRSPQRGLLKLYADALRRAIDQEALTMPGYDGAGLQSLSASELRPK